MRESRFSQVINRGWDSGFQRSSEARKVEPRSPRVPFRSIWRSAGEPEQSCEWNRRWPERRLPLLVLLSVEVDWVIYFYLNLAYDLPPDIWYPIGICGIPYIF